MPNNFKDTDEDGALVNRLKELGSSNEVLSLARQVERAQQEIATWSENRIRNVQLEGTDIYLERNIK